MDSARPPRCPSHAVFGLRPLHRQIPEARNQMGQTASEVARACAGRINRGVDHHLHLLIADLDIHAWHGLDCPGGGISPANYRYMGDKRDYARTRRGRFHGLTRDRDLARACAGRASLKSNVARKVWLPTRDHIFLDNPLRIATDIARLPHGAPK